MDIWPFSSNDNQNEIQNPNLKDIQPGWILEHVQGTLKVKNKAPITYNGTFNSTEWNLESIDGTKYFLEREVDDNVFWGLYEKSEFEKIPNLEVNSLSSKTFPRNMIHDGKSYKRLEYGEAVRDGRQGKESFLYADYKSTDDEYLALEVYEGHSVEVWIGKEVSEMDFDIIPE